MTLRTFVETPLNRLAQIALLQQRRRRGRADPVRAARFDNPVRLERNAALTGVVNSRRGVFSAWARTPPAAATRALLSDALSDNIVSLGATDRFQIRLEDSLGAIVINATSNFQMTDGGWHHYLAAWDTEQAQFDDRFRLFVDGAEDTLVPTVNQGLDIDYAGTTNWTVGASVFGANNLNGALAELVFAPGEWLDLTDADNVALFVRNGRPTPNLAAGLPFTPAVLMTGRRKNPASFARNRGTGGDFVAEGGSLRAHEGPPMRIGV